MPISEDRADRIESRIEELARAVNNLALSNAQQIEAGKRVGHLEDRVARSESALIALEKRVDSWINKGVGAVALISTLIMLYQLFGPILHKGP